MEGPKKETVNTPTEVVQRTDSQSAKNIMLMVLVGVVCVLAGVIIFLLYSRETALPNVAPVDIEENEEMPPGGMSVQEQAYDEQTDDPVTIPEYDDSIHPVLVEDKVDYRKYYTSLPKQSGVIWLDHPQFLGTTDQYPLIVGGTLCKQSSYGCPEIASLGFYKIGSYNNEEIVYTTLPCDDMICTEYPVIFVGSKDTGYRVVVQNTSVALFSENYRYGTAPDVTKDTETKFAALSIPKEYTFKGVVFNTEWEEPISGFFANMFSRFSEEQSGVEFVEVTPYGPLFRSLTPEHSPKGWARAVYAIRLPSGLFVGGKYTDPFMGDDLVPQIVWSDGMRNEIGYRGQTGGCGWGDTAVVRPSVPESDLVRVGQARTGEIIYGLKNQNHAFIQEVMGMTGGLYYTYEGGESMPHSYTVDDFQKAHGIILYTDALGLQRALINTVYGPQAECAKPVIYLYPKATTSISVQVHGKITKSDPVYGEGWRVVATPEGLITVDDSEYRSLFWDGYGYGVYPEITEGVVVKSSEALRTMESNLQSIGFSENEIADFSAFWRGHIPTQPYTRITWFLTRDMEKLARLTINPKPDTLIRAFVDFEGLDAPTELSQQILPHVERTGYVVTEWGGLMRRHGEE